jgi:hypothetical protein
MSKILFVAFSLCLIPTVIALVGCSNEAAAPKANPDAAAKGEAVDAEKEAAIAANMAKLSEEDRKAAEAQKFCAVETGNRLGGSMGVPYKVMIEGQPVFLCCDGCEEEALKDKQATLAKVAKLKQENAK